MHRSSTSDRTWGARLSALAVCALALGAASAPRAEESAGKILYARGTTSAQAPGAQFRIVDKDAALVPGDTIMTGADSFAVVQLADETRIMMRPQTTFTVQEVSMKAGSESIALNLLKGGIRALTGLISKRRPEGFRLTGAVATIGIRGTDFTARLCAEDCAGDAKAYVKTANTLNDQLVGRALSIVGAVSVANPDGRTRPLATGGPVYAGDTVESALHAYAVLAFRDETRVTLPPESRFKVEDYKFSPAAPEHENALFRLLRGGLRVATGLMAKRRPASFKVGTVVATIGVRGTGFDLAETGSCGGKQAAAGKNGLSAHVWKGAVAVEESNSVLAEGESGCLLEQGAAVTHTTDKPQLEGPRPDEVAIPANTFDEVAESGSEPGLHVSVLDGHVVLSNDGGELHLGAGEDGAASGLSSIPIRTRDEKSMGRGDAFFTLDLKSDAAGWDQFEPGNGVECPVGS